MTEVFKFVQGLAAIGRARYQLQLLANSMTDSGLEGPAKKISAQITELRRGEETVAAGIPDLISQIARQEVPEPPEDVGKNYFSKAVGKGPRPNYLHDDDDDEGI